MRRWNEVRERLRREGGPSATGDIWQRIETSRRAGAAVDLPREPRRTAARAGLYGALGLAAVLAIIPSGRDRSPATPASRVLDWSWPMLPEAALAQGREVTHLPAIASPDGTRLEPRLLVYAWTLPLPGTGRVDSVTIADTVTIRPGQVRGTPAWIMTQLLHRTRGRGAGRLDSLYLSAGDLRPLRSALFWARPDRLDSAMVMDFDGGKLRWNYRVPGGAGRDTTVIMRLPDQYYTIWTEMMPFLLNGLRLSDEWSGAVPMLMPTIGGVHSDSLAPGYRSEERR